MREKVGTLTKTLVVEYYISDCGREEEHSKHMLYAGHSGGGGVFVAPAKGDQTLDQGVSIETWCLGFPKVDLSKSDNA